MDFIENEAAKTITGMVRGIDELTARGSDLPVYRAALTLPLTQGGITAVLGAIAERPSGWAAMLQNTGGAGETFFVVAVDGVWRVWQQGITTITLPLSIANGGTGATTVDGARGNLGFAPLALPPRVLNHFALGGTAVNVGSGATTIIGNCLAQMATGATLNSSSRWRVLDNVPLSFLTGGRSIRFTRRIIFHTAVSVITTNAAGIFDVFFGKSQFAALGQVGQDYVGYRVSNSQVTAVTFANGGVVTVSVLGTPVTIPAGLVGLSVSIVSFNGTVTWYADGVQFATTTGGPIIAGVGAPNFEISNNSAASYSVNVISTSEGYF
jgi:hypothetical protein